MKAKEIQKHSRMGSQWLVQHQQPDGSWIGLGDPKVDAFYKGSWALAATGQLAAAHRVLDYALRHYLTPEGDFLPRGHPWHREVHYLYANAYFIIGSMITGRYEITMPAVKFLLSQQDPEHGGFYSRRVVPGEKELSDTMSAGAAGFACLAAGQIEAAERVGEYLSHIVDLQPTPDERFFTTIEADGQLGTDVGEDAVGWRIIETKIENQCWYAVGLPFAFLIQLADATNEARFRDLAQWYFDFQMRCVNPWDGGSSGKAGWGCAMLYRITGEERYRDIAFRVADMIMGKQSTDGGWIRSGQGYGEGGRLELTNADLDLTAEYTLWLALISSNILGRDAT